MANEKKVEVKEINLEAKMAQDKETYFLINNNQTKFLTIHYQDSFDTDPLTGKLAVKEKLFYPGTNHISLHEWNGIKKHPGIKHLMSKKANLLHWINNNTPEEGKPDHALKNLDAQDALIAINKTADVNLLKDWSDIETRREIRTAIDKQIKKIEDPNSENE